MGMNGAPSEHQDHPPIQSRVRSRHINASQLIKDEGLQEQWDADALFHTTYNLDGQIQTIFYENSRSLSYKLDLVNHTELGGIAIWALGYEGTTNELWEVIGQKLE
jgi:spore germination protein YaaH